MLTKLFLVPLFLALLVQVEHTPTPLVTTSTLPTSVSRRLLGSLTAANFNITTDQPITINSTRYIIRSITVSNTSTSLTLAVGGLYTATSKGGTPIVAATQIYSGLTGATKWLDLTLAAILGTDVRTETTLYFNLTTAQGGAATGNIYIFGDVLP